MKYRAWRKSRQKRYISEKEVKTMIWVTLIIVGVVIFLLGDIGVSLFCAGLGLMVGGFGNKIRAEVKISRYGYYAGSSGFVMAMVGVIIKLYFTVR